MSTRRFFQQFAIVAVSAAALSLALGRVLPHQHEGSASSPHVPSCRVCRLQEGFVAVASSQSVAQSLPPCVITAAMAPAAQPVCVHCPSSVLPRSPPHLA